MPERARILIVAFGPFPGVPVNPSAALARKLARTRRPALCNVAIDLEILPTRWDALPRLSRRLAQLAPDGVLLLGVAARRTALCVETRAVNAAADRPDAARRHPPARALRPGGPEVMRSTAPVARLLAAARGAFHPTRASRDAGRYLCNASYFLALEAANGRPVVFIHLPGQRGAKAALQEGNLPLALSHLLRALARAAATRRRPADRPTGP